MIQNSNNIKILDAINKKHLMHARNLITEFVKWHFQRHLDDKELINEYFDSKAFKEELKSLPGNMQSLEEDFCWLYIMLNQPVV